MVKRSPTIYVIPYLHWQREGDQPFEHSRLRLVSQIDRLLNSQNDSTVLLNGQSVLNDYLTVRPSRADQLTALLRTNQLDPGPWYVPPEPFLVSPEALIRNLLLGRSAVGEGTASPQAAYMPDILALPGQLPQILRGFGVEALVTPLGGGRQSLEQWWDAPDGSRVMLVNVPPLDEHAYEIDALGSELASRSHTGLLPLFENTRPGVHQQILTEWGIKNATCSLDAYLEDAQSANDFYPLLTGGLLPADSPLTHSGMLSSRIWLKQQYRQASTTLEQWAEPFSAWAALTAMSSAALEDQHELLMYAWQLIVESHSPDALRGTCIDQVEQEVEARLDRAVQIGNALAGENLRALARAIDTSMLPAGDGARQVAVFNGGGQASTGLVSLTLPFERNAVHCEVVDEAGQTTPCEVLIDTEADSQLMLRFVAEAVPAYGYRAYTIRPAECLEPFEYTEDNGTQIENDLLSVRVNPEDGTLTLADKQTATQYSGLNRFVDGGDRGDLHQYLAPERDTIIDFPSNTPVQVTRLVGPVTQMLNIFQIYRLPKSLTADGWARVPLTRQFAPVPITTTVYLTRGVPRVDVEVTIENLAEDHRLAVHFPVETQTGEALYGGHFEVIRRPTTRATEHPQQEFVTIQGASTGLTVASQGLPAARVLPHGKRSAEIVLTLLRCVGRRGGASDTPTPRAQGIGFHTFAYSLIPHGSAPLAAWQQARAFQSRLQAQFIELHDGGVLPASASLASVDNPAFVLSAVKQPVDGHGLIVRGYNVSAEPQPVHLGIGVPFSTVTFARLDETPLNTVPTVDSDGTCTFEAAPHEIVTLRFDT